MVLRVPYHSYACRYPVFLALLAEDWTFHIEWPWLPCQNSFDDIYAFELWCWRRLLQILWTARRFNQFILKETSPGCSLEGLRLRLKLQYFATSCEELTHWKSPWCWEGLGAGGERDDRGWDGWMASLTQWAWVWVNSGSWWWPGRPGVLWFMGSQSWTRLSYLTDEGLFLGSILFHWSKCVSSCQCHTILITVAYNIAWTTSSFILLNGALDIFCSSLQMLGLFVLALWKKCHWYFDKGLYRSLWIYWHFNNIKVLNP